MKNPLKRTANPLLIVMLSILLLTGCWDRVEINDRVFVLAIAIDKFEPYATEPKAGPGTETGLDTERPGHNEGSVRQPTDSHRNQITVSLVFPNIGLLKEEGAIVPKGAKFAVSTVAPNVSEAIRQFNTRFNGNIFFGHVKAILVGTDLLCDRELFLRVLDELERSHEIIRNVNFISVKGRAKKALFIEPLTEPIVGIYVQQIIEQSKTGRLHSKDLGHLVASLRETGGALMPRMVVAEDEVKIAGSCLIKDYKHRAWLGELETRAIQWLDNMAGEDIISVDVDGVSVPFELTGLKRRMEVRRGDDESIRLCITIKTEGNIAGYTMQPQRDVMEHKFIEKVESSVKGDIEAQCAYIMDRMQHEFRLDLLGIGNHIKKFSPDIWDDVKWQWEDVFPEVKVNISADVKVRRVGIIK